MTADFSKVGFSSKPSNGSDSNTSWWLCTLSQLGQREEELAKYNDGIVHENPAKQTQGQLSFERLPRHTCASLSFPAPLAESRFFRTERPGQDNHKTGL